MIGIQSVAVGSAGLHRAGPLANFLLLLCLVSAVLAFPSLIVEVAVLAVAVGLALISGEGPRSWFRSLRFVVVFAFVLFLAQALSVHSGRLVLGSPIRLTLGGLTAGGQMALRFLVILFSSYLFVRTVDPDRWVHGLIRMGIPYRYGYLLVLALRFVPFFQEELRAVREAQQIRGIEVSVRSPRRLLHAVRYTFVPVLVSGLHRVDTLAMSMKGRAFGLHPTRTTTVEERVGGWSIAAVAVGILVVGLAFAATRKGWVG